jgi:ABC-type multidrug transport system permease subunit
MRYPQPTFLTGREKTTLSSCRNIDPSLELKIKDVIYAQKMGVFSCTFAVPIEMSGLWFISCLNVTSLFALFVFLISSLKNQCF